MKPIYGARQTVYRNAHQSVYRVQAGGSAGTRDIYVTDYGPRAATVVEGPRGILLTRQYRYLIDTLSFEIPGGKSEEGEAPIDTAARECLEETGVRPLGLKPLIMFHPGLDTLHNPTYVFHSAQFEIVAASLHQDEVHETAWLPLERCLAMISEGKIVDSLSLISLLAYARYQENL